MNAELRPLLLKIALEKGVITQCCCGCYHRGSDDDAEQAAFAAAAVVFKGNEFVAVIELSTILDEATVPCAQG